MAVCLVVHCVRAVYPLKLINRHVHLSVSVQKLVQFNLSDIGEGIREVTVKNWFVKENDVVEQFDEICEVESDKASVNITSRYDGKVMKLHHKIGDIALVGKPLLDIEVNSEESEVEEENIVEENVEEISEASENEPERKSSEETTTNISESDEYSTKNWNKSLATPAVRRIAMEYKIKLSDVKGTGKLGRVMKEDILGYLDERRDGKDSLHARTTPLTSLQKVMKRTMTKSQTIPKFVLSDEVDATKLVHLRSEVKHHAEKKSVKLSYLPFFLKAVSKGLAEHPILNSSVDDACENITYMASHNIGIAVDTPQGLIVPNVKNVQELSVLQIGREINRLQDLASNGKLSPSDLNGGTFSVSNIGSIAGTFASPMILPPELCILAIGKIQRLPRFDTSGNVTAANVLYISWSADHRIIDGATMARFSEIWKYYIQNPSSLLLDV